MAHLPRTRKNRPTADELEAALPNAHNDEARRRLKLRIRNARAREREQAERREATEQMGPAELADLVYQHIGPIR